MATHGNKLIDIVDSYKYLGVLLDKNLSYEECTKILGESSGRAFGSLVLKFNDLKNMVLKLIQNYSIQISFPLWITDQQFGDFVNIRSVKFTRKLLH